MYFFFFFRFPIFFIVFFFFNEKTTRLSRLVPYYRREKERVRQRDLLKDKTASDETLLWKTLVSFIILSYVSLLIFPNFFFLILSYLSLSKSFNNNKYITNESSRSFVDSLCSSFLRFILIYFSFLSLSRPSYSVYFVYYPLKLTFTSVWNFSTCPPCHVMLVRGCGQKTWNLFCRHYETLILGT